MRAPAAWVLLKGVKQDARHWRDLPDRIARATGVAAWATELPGAGAQAGRRSPTSVDGLLDDVRRRLPLDLPRPLGLVGLSLGGMVVLRWAQRHEEDVAGAVVGNTSAGDHARPWWRLDRRSWRAFLAALAEPDPVARERRALDLVSATLPPWTRDAVAVEHAAWQAAAGIRRADLLRQVVAGGRYRLGAPPRTPVRVLVGAADRFVDPRCSFRLAEALGIAPVVHPHAGHDLTLDAPDWVVAQVAAFHHHLGAGGAGAAPRAGPDGLSPR